MTSMTQQGQQHHDVPVVESWRSHALDRDNRQWFYLKLVAFGLGMLIVAGLGIVLYPHLTRTPTVYYETLIVPTITRGDATLYGIREVLQSDGWIVHWGHADNTAFAWKSGEGILVLVADRTTASREKVNKPALQFTPAVVLEGRNLYAPAAFFTALLGDAFRIDATSDQVQLRR